MLLNLISLICAPVSYGFPSGKDNTVKKDSSPDGKSKITKELDKVTFVELRKNAAFYMEVDADKDVVVAIGPWRMLAFIDNGAGSGIDETLRKMQHSEIGNLILVSAPGDGLFKDLMGTVEDEEEKAKKKPEPTANNPSDPEKPAKQPQRRPKSKPEPEPKPEPATFVDLAGIDDEDDD